MIIEMFEYIINLGGTKQTYIPKLLRYLEVYLCLLYTSPSPRDP